MLGSDMEKRMKATLEYQLPEEMEELRSAVDGSTLAGAVQGFDQKLRQLVKHAESNDPLAPGLKRARELLRNELEDELLYVLG